MDSFHNVLFVNLGFTKSLDALIQAIKISVKNHAHLTILSVYPRQIEALTKDVDDFKNLLAQNIEATIAQACDKINVVRNKLKLKIEVASWDNPAIQIVQRVLQDKHDLVVKDAETSNATAGFAALDMALLRKCPCPVWLCRPISKHSDKISVAVAIDPIVDQNSARELNFTLLELAGKIACTCNNNLQILSCWDCVAEEYIKHSSWLTVSSSELQEMVAGVKQEHLDALHNVIQHANISSKFEIQHLRGRPDEIIPTYVQDKNIDILIMGTVARTGIPGFIIGNTAENIVQQLNCTLVALKPTGFVSPVKAN